MHGKVCEYLREQAMEIINLNKKKMKPLTNEQQKSYENAKFCKNKFTNKHAKNKNIVS